MFLVPKVRRLTSANVFGLLIPNLSLRCECWGAMVLIVNYSKFVPCPPFHLCPNQPLSCLGLILIRQCFSYCFAVFKVLLYKLFHTVLAKSLGGVSLYSFFIDIETKALRSDPGIYTSNSSPLVTRSCILSIISPLTELCARILWGESGI